MKTNEKANRYDAIDRMFSAMLSMNESKEQVEALREEAEEAVKALIAERGLPRNWTGTLEYHGFITTGYAGRDAAKIGG